MSGSRVRSDGQLSSQPEEGSRISPQADSGTSHLSPAPCSVCIRRAAQPVSLQEEERVLLRFELRPHAPRMSEGRVRSKQGSWGGIPVPYVLRWPGARRERGVTEAAVEGTGSLCDPAAERSASPLVPRGLFCGRRTKEPFKPSGRAGPALSAERPIRSCLSQRLVYALQMCTM